MLQALMDTMTAKGWEQAPLYWEQFNLGQTGQGQVCVFKSGRWGGSSPQGPTEDWNSWLSHRFSGFDRGVEAENLNPGGAGQDGDVTRGWRSEEKTDSDPQTAWRCYSIFFHNKLTVSRRKIWPYMAAAADEGDDDQVWMVTAQQQLWYLEHFWPTLIHIKTSVLYIYIYMVLLREILFPVVDSNRVHLFEYDTLVHFWVSWLYLSIYFFGEFMIYPSTTFLGSLLLLVPFGSA